MLVEIPTRNDLPSYEMIVPLDGTNYTISLYFNPRINNGQGKWFLVLADENRNLLVGPVPVVANWALVDRFVELGIPPGTVFCFDTTGADEDPTQFSLGARHRLYYLEAGST